MIRLHHFIFERDKTGNVHPVYDCYRMDVARQELHSRQKYSKTPSLYYIVSNLEATEPTKMEAFVQLLYNTRDLQRKFFKSKKREYMVSALAGEKQIDGWLARYESYRQQHPDYRLPNEHDQKLFENVYEWRIVMKEWSRNKTKSDLKRRLQQTCQNYEAVIDDLLSYRLDHYTDFL